MVIDCESQGIGILLDEIMYCTFVGLTIQHGNSLQGAVPRTAGGAVYSENSYSTFVDCTFASCYASSRGGAVYSHGDGPIFERCLAALPEQGTTQYIGSGSYHYEYPTATNLEMPRYTMDSPVSDILEAPGGPELLEKAHPGITGNSMLNFIKAMSLEQLASHERGPDRELFEELLAKLNKSPN